MTIRDNTLKWGVNYGRKTFCNTCPWSGCQFSKGRVTRRLEKSLIKKTANNLQAKNIYTKAQFESPKHLQQKPFWKTLKYNVQSVLWNCLFRSKCYKFALAKSSPKCCHFFGLFYLFKKSLWVSKSSQIGKEINLVTLF
jgi:hypothetical protein